MLSSRWQVASKLHARQCHHSEQLALGASLSQLRESTGQTAWGTHVSSKRGSVNKLLVDRF